MAAIDLPAIARELGFARAAVIPIEPARRAEVYRTWLAAGHAADMTYLATPAHVLPRADPAQLLAAARSLVVVALAYGTGAPPRPPGDVIPRGQIARYARGTDYHLVMRDRLVALADRLATLVGRPIAARPCVDSAPVFEREWAERGALGFVAKNTMLIAPGLGSYVVLGELLTDLAPEDLPITAPETPPKPRCGSCTACLDACPTRAFVAAYTLDARRCISYLTIEHRGPLPRELRAQIGTWIFGCDICQEVCPWNATPAGERAADPELRAVDLAHALPDLAALTRAPTNQVRQFVKRTALRRIPHDHLLRNVAVALGNTRDAAAVPPLVALLADRRALVRTHAAWGLVQHLPDPAAAAALADPDLPADVRAEIAASTPTSRTA